MKKFVSAISLFILPFFLLTGCNLGPSNKQVRKAMEATVRSFASSLDDPQDLEVSEQYANAAKAVFRNKDGSVVTSMGVFMREDGLQVYGTSTFTDYEDAKSDYTVNGELTYNIMYPLNLNPREAYGEMSCSAMLSGGKIESLEFSVNGDGSGAEEYMVTANDHFIDFKDTRSIFEIFEEISRKMPG